eukprot:3940752-Rhodomonas_salina.1
MNGVKSERKKSNRGASAMMEPDETLAKVPSREPRYPPSLGTLSVSGLPHNTAKHILLRQILTPALADSIAQPSNPHASHWP